MAMTDFKVVFVLNGGRTNRINMTQQKGTFE